MLFLNKLTALYRVKEVGSSRFPYPEAFVLILTVFLIAVDFNFSAVSIALIIVIGLPSIIILASNYYQQPKFWASNGVIVLLAMVIGALQFCSIVSLSIVLLIATRVIISRPEHRIRLAMVAVITAIMFYYVSITLKGVEVHCNQGILPPALLLMSISTVLWKFWHTHHHYLSQDDAVRQATGRIQTMVSIINKLTRFVPLQVWQPIVKTNTPVTVSNKRAKLTIMFSDIVGFTELSESLSADNLADILNTYMHTMTLIADKHGAVLDKFIGDGMVCFFGEPNSQGTRQDAIACVAMAIDMRREMRSLRQTWRLMGFEGLYVRIGITTGYCHVGNFGSNNRMSYTLIGKEANLASRLESTAGKGEILISQSTYDYICHEYECKYSGVFSLKGFDEEIHAWQVLDPDAHKGQLSKWVDHKLPGFNLHLNFKDIKNYDYKEIKNHLNFALERLEREQKTSITKEK